MPMWSSLYLQDRISPVIQQLLLFHDHSLIVLIIITVFTFYISLLTFISFSFNRFLNEGQEIETIWTILPRFILLLIAFPSLKILYIIEESNFNMLTIKVNGHQWYWRYEQSDFQKSVDTFLEERNSFRLLNTSDSIFFLSFTPYRLLISSEDVIHSWTIPSIGVKVDAVPGRINQLSLISFQTGIFSGQCSEICGINHSFIPIFSEVINSHYIIKLF